MQISFCKNEKEKQFSVISNELTFQHKNQPGNKFVQINYTTKSKTKGKQIQMEHYFEIVTSLVEPLNKKTILVKTEEKKLIIIRYNTIFFLQIYDVKNIELLFLCLHITYWTPMMGCFDPSTMWKN